MGPEMELIQSEEPCYKHSVPHVFKKCVILQFREDCTTHQNRTKGGTLNKSYVVKVNRLSWIHVPGAPQKMFTVVLLEEVTLCFSIKPPYGYSICIQSALGLKLALSTANAKLFPRDKYLFSSSLDLQPRSQIKAGLHFIGANIYRAGLRWTLQSLGCVTLTVCP